MVFSNKFVRLCSMFTVSYSCCGSSLRKDNGTRSESLDPVTYFMTASVFSSLGLFSNIIFSSFLILWGVPLSCLRSLFYFGGFNTTINC